MPSQRLGRLICNRSRRSSSSFSQLTELPVRFRETARRPVATEEGDPRSNQVRSQGRPALPLSCWVPSQHCRHRTNPPPTTPPTPEWCPQCSWVQTNPGAPQGPTQLTNAVLATSLHRERTAASSTHEKSAPAHGSHSRLTSAADRAMETTAKTGHHCENQPSSAPLHLPNHMIAHHPKPPTHISDLRTSPASSTISPQRNCTKTQGGTLFTDIHHE